MLKNQKGVTLIELMIIAAVVAIIGAIILWPCRALFVKPTVAVRALETQGFSEVRVIDKNWFLVRYRGCARGDNVRFVAKAKNPAGKEVEVLVCVGWPFKGATVRTR